MNEKDIQRFQKKIELDLLTGCWVWKGTLEKNTGYGKITINVKSEYAHRVAYIHWNGEVPKGLELDHLCRNKNCVNPSHLEAVTHYENNLRGISPAAINAKKTHCMRGHEFAGDNLIIALKSGARLCRICKNQRNLNYYHRSKLECL